jgi:hypothetical protein
MTIYDKHDKAFQLVSAFVLAIGAEKVGTVAIKYPKDGAGRLTAYVHIIGTEMVLGTASGYGYDKASAALESAARKFTATQCENMQLLAVVNAMANVGGRDWTDALRDIGFNVIRAV